MPLCEDEASLQGGRRLHRLTRVGIRDDIAYSIFASALMLMVMNHDA